MKKLFVVGDSISIHYGPYLHNLVRDKFDYARKGGVRGAKSEIENPALVNGGDSDMVLSYLQEQRSSGFHTDLLLLNCGLHDIKRDRKAQKLQVSRIRYRENLHAICEAAKLLSQKIFWIRTTLLDDSVHAKFCDSIIRRRKDVLAYNRVADEIMKSQGIPMIDLAAFTESLKGPLYCDHVHFTESVRGLQAAFIADHIWHCA